MARQLRTIGVARLLSKVSGVARAGLAASAAILSAVDSSLLTGIANLPGIARFTSKCRTITIRLELISRNCCVDLVDQATSCNRTPNERFTQPRAGSGEYALVPRICTVLGMRSHRTS